MKYAFLASLMAIGMAACGDGKSDLEADLIKRCVSDGAGDLAACECRATALINAIGEDQLKELAELGAEDEEAVTEKAVEIAIANPDAAVKVGEAMMTCGL